MQQFSSAAIFNEQAKSAVREVNTGGGLTSILYIEVFLDAHHSPAEEKRKTNPKHFDGVLLMTVQYLSRLS